jgi:NosR/NirI family nitrous oxide reductase transcriptional regulator
MKGPVTAVRLGDLFSKKGPEPSYPTLPAVDDDGRSSLPGVYVVGDAAGTPLLKLGMNAGVRTADAVIADSGTASDADVVVVGAGAAGLACAMRLQKRGAARVVVVEAGSLGQTVVSMTKGKHIFAEPAGVKNESELWLGECTREELLEKWRAAAAALDVREHTKLVDVKKSPDGFTVETSAGALACKRVVLAVGKSGNPRKAKVPGEDLPHVKYLLDDAAAVAGADVVVYGGGDVACEAALALADNNRVTLATIDAALTFPKKRNRDAVLALVEKGRLTLRLGSKLAAIAPASVRLADDDVPADRVYVMIGAEPPVALFKKIGLGLAGEWGARKYLTAAAVFLAVYSLYALKKFPDTPFAWPFTLFIDRASFAHVVDEAFSVAFAPFAWTFSDKALADIHATTWFQQGYLYSLAYTLVMIVFGWRAMMRWTSTAKRPSYQKWRYVSLVSFQVVFFLAANVVAVQALSIQHSWRAWGLYQPWPLFFHTFNWWNASDPAVVKWGFIGAGLAGTFVVIPLLSWKNGKRFCTWVCGCGGLAETLGDRWRDKAPKGKRARAWEFQAFVVLGAAALATAVTVGAFGTRADNPWALTYSYVVDFWLVAVIPVALYPFFGGKIWCRYWCPLAAWNQILARLYGRLGIVSNDQCISCGQCSKHCEVGVDVMQFARKEERFDNKNSSCIQCGICVDVCPVDVLSFSTAKPRGRSLPIVS